MAWEPTELQNLKQNLKRRNSKCQPRDLSSLLSSLQHGLVCSVAQRKFRDACYVLSSAGFLAAVVRCAPRCIGLRAGLFLLQWTGHYCVATRANVPGYIKLVITVPSNVRFHPNPYSYSTRYGMSLHDSIATLPPSPTQTPHIVKSIP